MAPDIWQELYEERAAIKEHLGGMSREQAEREAKAEIDAMRPLVQGMEFKFD
jgi:hypothetical protein